MRHTLGIEFGSTRIKAVLIDDAFRPVASGDYTWKSDYVDGIWTYDLEEVWKGLKAAIAGVEHRENIAAMGVSAMMHGYLAISSMVPTSRASSRPYWLKMAMPLPTTLA